MDSGRPAPSSAAEAFQTRRERFVGRPPTPSGTPSSSRSTCGATYNLSRGAGRLVAAPIAPTL